LRNSDVTSQTDLSTHNAERDTDTQARSRIALAGHVSRLGQQCGNNVAALDGVSMYHNA